MTATAPTIAEQAELTDAMEVLSEIAAGPEAWPYGDNGGRERPQLYVPEARALLRSVEALQRDAARRIEQERLSKLAVTVDV